ncbi:4-(cytidine 5'-diphospho)-2-C-methyl-D-erythritol kinase [Oceaniglobus roseus]|uniref:4-(cytidine 5'-diphospho)-2-C-methyl-D-erythritol kinase n=1 Tax=Oceaniglobus roseus TaxID=1737570 RepID=UPI000C7F0303|nr:4-(cytidine 5'-diphospho)-2-C-methyl-D-erythritol kinase [Kandeliimicrobium roseum]
MTAEAFAPAKINLTLHVTGQRADGYHLLDSLVVFAGVGDTVSARPDDTLSLTIDGPYGAGLSADPDNLVLRAARAFGGGQGVALHLTKRLPVASGIGGGSADAAATLRLLSNLWDCPLPDEAAILALGADVPVCLRGAPVRMAGTGEILSDVPPIPPFDLLLVNPSVAVSTPAVFRALATKTNPGMGALPEWGSLAAFADWLAAQRNDLLRPAVSLAPVLTEALDLIRGTGALFAGMSGSGATCFGIFPTGAATGAEAAIRAARPDWWSVATEAQVMRATT